MAEYEIKIKAEENKENKSNIFDNLTLLSSFGITPFCCCCNLYLKAFSLTLLSQ